MAICVPFRQFVLKVHSRCDLACDHCYVYEHADQSWRTRPRCMAPATARMIAARIAEHVRAHDVPGVCIVLHGGEPLLAGPARLAEIIVALRSELDGLCDVDLRIHTNGIRLDARFCELFRRHGVKVGISLDGDRAGNDRHRRYANGRSSYDGVLRAIELVRGQIPELFSGLLCTIDVRNDPVTVYRELARHQPPAIDFLLQHATWDNPPDRPSQAAYADWLIRIFDQWQADGMTVPVRMFDSVIRTAHGGGSLTESLGLEPSDLIVVETDGALEQADSLKTAYHGAPATGFTVFTHSLDDVAQHPGIVARQRGLAGLAATCRACPVVTGCGGGLYAHRYRTGSGFMNPSVYCADLLKLIQHIWDRTDHPVHSLPGSAMDLLASGYGDAEAIMTLAAAQQTLQRTLLAAIPDNADTAAAWSLITRIDREHPSALDETLAYPYVRVWITRCLQGRAEAADMSPIAAVAAIRAGLDAELRLPVRAGMVHLPTIGSWRVDKTADFVRLCIGGGTYHFPRGSEALPLRRLTAAGMSVVLDDLDPFRDCYECPTASRLDDREFSVWQDRFLGAWALIERDYPAYAPGLATGLSAIVPLASARRDRNLSATARAAFGAVAIALPAEPDVLALLLLHEFQHVKLGALLDMLDLCRAGDAELYYAPWRTDPRPLEGLLQGAYAHLAVTDYWRVRRTVLTDEGESLAAAAAFARWRQETMDVIGVLLDSGALTEQGRRFADGMRGTVIGWLSEPVPSAATGIAARSARRHHRAWLQAHGRGTDQERDEADEAGRAGGAR